jgi:predicted secreted Zn-dependent protease
MRPSGPPSRAELTWRIAANCEGGTCVRVAASDDLVFIGDSKNPEGPLLACSKVAWKQFVKGVRDGVFDGL